MIQKEPTIILGALSEVIRAVIPTLIALGLIHWTSEQVAQVMLLVSVLIGFLNVLLARTQVVSMAVADKQIEIAKASSIDTPTDRIIQQAKESV